MSGTCLKNRHVHSSHFELIIKTSCIEIDTSGRREKNNIHFKLIFFENELVFLASKQTIFCLPSKEKNGILIAYTPSMHKKFVLSNRLFRTRKSSEDWHEVRKRANSIAVNAKKPIILKMAFLNNKKDWECIITMW